MINKIFLNNLLNAKSPSGYETEAIEVFNNYCSQFAQHEGNDAIGNSCFSTGEGKIPFMISGHIDEIAMQVQYIDEHGFIYFIKDGGIDPKTLLGTTVSIMTNKGNVSGVIGKKPIHVEGDEKEKATALTSMKIDGGFETLEEAKEYISIGDPIVFASRITQLGVNRFSSHGLDDKVGVYITAEVLKRLSKVPLNNLKVYGCACTQEEVSGLGALTLSKRIDPRYSIDYDVTFATDDDFVSPKEWGDIKLGKGGAIAFGTDNNPKLANFIRNIAKENKFPYQEFSLEPDATNTTEIKRGSSNCYTALLSIPNRNMHTQVEVCDYRDIEALIDLTVATIISIDKNPF